LTARTSWPKLSDQYTERAVIEVAKVTQFATLDPRLNLAEDSLALGRCQGRVGVNRLFDRHHEFDDIEAV
jgi:hypothetical protein